jgi:hypothetical protein
VRRIPRICGKRALDRSADGDETVTSQPAAYISPSERARLAAGQTAMVLPSRGGDDPAGLLCFVERPQRTTWRERTVRAKFRLCTSAIFAWHLLPTIRFGVYSSRQGFFVALTFLKFDLCSSLDWGKD